MDGSRRRWAQPLTYLVLGAVICVLRQLNTLAISNVIVGFLAGDLMIFPVEILAVVLAALGVIATTRHAKTGESTRGLVSATQLPYLTTFALYLVLSVINYWMFFILWW